VVQTSFWVLGGGDLLDWTKQMRSFVAYVHKKFPSIYATFIASGSAHCRSQDDGFFGVEAKGVHLADWVGSIAEGTLPKDEEEVDCCAGAPIADTADGPAAAPNVSALAETLGRLGPWQARLGSWLKGAH